jgi:hypothetical protein
MQLKSAAQVAGGLAAWGAGTSAAFALTRDRDPWTLDYGGPGSIEQVPSLFVPWGLPAVGTAFGAIALLERGHNLGAAALGYASLALLGAGVTTWMVGKSTP